MKEKLTLGASVITAITASLCCICPLVAVLMGLGAFGATALFEAMRPYFLGSTFLLLAFAFYFTYGSRQEESCANDGACRPGGIARFNKPLLWIATLVALLFAGFPYYSAAVSRVLIPQTTVSSDETPIARQSQTVRVQRIQVSGMTCGGCAASIHQALIKLTGVVSAEVNLERKQALVRYESSKVTPQQLVDAISKAGYTAVLQKQNQD